MIRDTAFLQKFVNFMSCVASPCSHASHFSCNQKKDGGGLGTKHSSSRTLGGIPPVIHNHLSCVQVSMAMPDSRRGPQVEELFISALRIAVSGSKLTMVVFLSQLCVTVAVLSWTAGLVVLSNIPQCSVGCGHNCRLTSGKRLHWSVIIPSLSLHWCSLMSVSPFSSRGRQYRTTSVRCAPSLVPRHIFSVFSMKSREDMPGNEASEFH